jgi:hypothetical protein|tara:strand:- start:1964 stop:2215 length:252 start_codon:yes stop_codon:yes gene_type:complete
MRKMSHSSPWVTLKTLPSDKALSANHATKAGRMKLIGAGSFGFTTQASQADRTARNFRPLPNVGLVLIAEAVKRKVIVTPINS